MKRFLHIKAVFAFVIFATAGCSSLSVPSLESPVCTEAREFARSFYSTHFDSEMKPTAESIESKSGSLTGNFAEKLRNQSLTAKDPFTLTENYPRAFKLGGCEALKEGSVSLEVQLLWRDNDVSRQESINAIMLKENNSWLIDDIVRTK